MQQKTSELLNLFHLFVELFLKCRHKTYFNWNTCWWFVMLLLLLPLLLLIVFYWNVNRNFFLLLIFLFSYIYLCSKTSNCSWCRCRFFCCILRFRFNFAYLALLHPIAWIMLQHVPIILLHNLQWIKSLKFYYGVYFVRSFVDWFTAVSVVIHKNDVARPNRYIRSNAMVHTARKKNTFYANKWNWA